LIWNVMCAFVRSITDATGTFTLVFCGSNVTVTSAGTNEFGRPVVESDGDEVNRRVAGLAVMPTTRGPWTSGSRMAKLPRPKVVASR